MVLFGLYVGNTSACIALFKKGQIEVISNDVGERLTPSIVAFTASDLVVGKEAKQCLMQNDSYVIHSMKNNLYYDENVQESNASYKMIYKDDIIFYEIKINNKPSVISIIDILSSVFKKLMDCAKSQVGVQEPYEAVMTVPFHFKEKQRKIICEAATTSGFKILRLINEPSASLIAYNIGQEDPHENLNILVLRIGGESMDITLVNHISGFYRIIDYIHDNKSGGFLIDNMIVEHLLSEFKRQTQLDCHNNTRAMFKIRTCAEQCKRILSNLNTTNCSLESLHKDKDFNFSVSRSRIELLAGPLLHKWIGEVDSLLIRCNIKIENLNKIILCGGMCRMPLVQQTMKDKFLNCDYLFNLPTDEIYAIGAAIQASFLSGKDNVMLKRNEESNKILCLSQTILIKQEEDAVKSDLILFPAYCPIPTRKHLDFNLLNDETNIILILKQQLSDGSIKRLARIVITDVTSKAVNVAFHIKQDSSLHIHWKSGNDLKQQSLIITTHSNDF